MAQAIKIEAGEKEYILGFPTRESARQAELKGFDFNLLESQPVTQSDRLFYSALCSNQKEMTVNLAMEIKEKYIAEGGDIAEINSFLLNQYVGFIVSQEKKKKAKKAVIIEI